MKILSEKCIEHTIITGRLSDGSDRETKQLIIYTIRVDDGNKLMDMVFDHSPSEEEISAAITTGSYEDVTDEVYRLQKRVELAESALNELIMGGM